MYHEESLIETALVWMLAGALVTVFLLIKIGAFEPGNNFNEALSGARSPGTDLAEGLGEKSEQE